MVFSTIIFLFRFLPITLALYYLAPPKLKNTVLFLCSLVFYCWGEVRFFPVMVALILINYLSGLAIEHFDAKPALRRFFLLVALIGSLGMLFYFKYANFVLRSANALLGTAFAEIQGIGTLPLGISFYTFQTLSYSIDVYRRDVKAERNIIDFGAYVVMFPQLIAGPIVKYRDVSDQLHVYKHRYHLKQIEEGMTLFTFGLAKKVLLADAVGALWTDIIGVADSPSTTFVGLANASTPLVWLGIIAYSLQLYFDFSGYSMMGIGMASGNVEEHSVEAIKAKGVLVVTTEAGYAPFEFLDENDNVVGLDASLAQALADDLGVELDIQNIAFDSVVAEVQAGNADMAIAGLTPNADRKKSVDMSDMYYAGGQCMLVLEENLDKYATKESLAGAVMATQKAALQETLMAEQFPDAEPLLLPDFPQCIANLKNGECAAVMIDEISAEQYMQTVEGLAIGKVPVEIDPEEGGNAVAVMKGNTDLLDWVNERIAAYEAEGLLEQWFQEAQEKAASMGIE